MSLEAIDEIFWNAAQLPSATERDAYLDRACAGDEEMRQRVERLLLAQSRANDFFERPALLPTTASEEEDLVGAVIGPYTLVEKLGAGGFGVVYKARQEQPIRRDVALKILKPGMDSAAVLARFEQERQALAVMNHPNIARVIDAGMTDGGRPYFVMELITGVAITTYCDEHRLSSVQRLDLFVQVCQAIQHAHQKGIIHRDIKPSNVMVANSDGKPVAKVIDFGIAKAVDGSLADTSLSTGAYKMMGTPLYMSPEQAGMGNLDIDTRSDIYSLGVLLYELLTGTTPIDRQRLASAGYDEIRRIIREEEPPRPSTRINTPVSAGSALSAMQPDSKPARQVPGEVDWIVMKCLEKDRTRRYETAAGLAADVGRFLRNEPVQACPPSWGYRARKFVRRNTWPVIAATLLVVALGGSVGGIAWGFIHAAQTKAAEAEARERTKIREVLIQKLMQIRLGPHQMGWAEECRNLAWQAGKIHKDEELRDQYAATLAGMDARIDRTFKFTAYNVAWSKDGKQLLMGGWEKEPAKLWNGGDDAPVASQKAGPGPAAFRPDGSAVQVVFEDSHTYLLWDMKKQATIHELKFPLEKDVKPDAKDEPCMAIADDASYVVASPTVAEGKGVVAVWETATGKLLHRLPGKATALALTPAAKGQAMYVAAGFENGRVKVWSVAEGKEVLDLQVSRLPVYAIAFGRDPRRQAKKDSGPLAGWLLAAGGSGGHLSVWSLDPVLPQAFLRGSPWGVYALAFSPDSTILASAGRDMVKFWDVAREKLLLNVRDSNYAVSMAFSPNGNRVAVSNALEGPSVRIVELEKERGFKTMYGLNAPVAKVALSSDVQLVGALSQEWQLAVWNLKGDRLMHVFEVPVGVWADNAALAFSPDGTRLAFSSSGGAKLWDIDSGKELQSWTLPPGLQDDLAFPANDRLLLLRVETEDMKHLPASNAHGLKHPRVCRVRNLLGKSPLEPFPPFTGLPLNVYMCMIPGDGTNCTVEGLDANRKHMIKAFTATNGRELWSLPTTRQRGSVHSHVTDPEGKLVALQTDDKDSSLVVEVATGRLVRTLTFFPHTLSAQAKSCVATAGLVVSYWPVDSPKPVLRLGVDSQPEAGTGKFNRAGTGLVWGNKDGTVTVADLGKVRARLKKAGVALDW